MGAKPDFIYYLLRWLRGFLEIADGLCLLVSLGFYRPNLAMRCVMYDAKRLIKKRMGPTPSG